MKILVSTRGSRGDVHPFIAIASALGKRGHDVTLCLPDTFVAEARRRGVVARGHAEDSHVIMRRFGGGWEAVRTTLQWFARSIDEQFDYLLAESVDADVLVASTNEIAAPSVAELRGIPFVRVAFAPMMTSSESNALLPWQGLPRWANRAGWSALNVVVDAMAFQTMRRWRSSLGLAPVLRVGDHVARHGLSLLAMSRELSPPCSSWEGRYRYEYCGYCHDEAVDPLPEDVQRFLEAGPRPVYVGLGSVAVADPELLSGMVRDAALQVGCRVVLGAGWAGLGRGLSSGFVRVVGEVDHRALFPLTAGVVHHGGSGTTHVAARAGIPQLVLPQIADQYYWGHRVERLGLGPAPLPMKSVTVASLVRALGQLVGEPQFALQAARTGRIVSAERGVLAVVEAIEGVAGRTEARGQAANPRSTACISGSAAARSMRSNGAA